MTEPLDQVRQSIVDLNNAMNVLFTDFVRPTTLQTQANAEAIAQIAENLSRAEAIAESNARSIAAEGDRVRELRESVELLRDVADDTAAETAPHESRISENESRFDILLAESRAERAEYAQRFDSMQQEIRALGEQNRALLSALASTNGRVDNLERGVG